MLFFLKKQKQKIKHSSFSNFQRSRSSFAMSTRTEIVNLSNAQTYDNQDQLTDGRHGTALQDQEEDM